VSNFNPRGEFDPIGPTHPAIAGFVLLIYGIPFITIMIFVVLISNDFSFSTAIFITLGCDALIAFAIICRMRAIWHSPNSWELMRQEMMTQKKK